MGTKSKTREREDDSDIRTTLRIDRARTEAQFGIAFGQFSGTRGPVNVLAVEQSTNYRVSAVFAHNPDLACSPGGGMHVQWVSIPYAGEQDRHEEGHDRTAELKGLRRKASEETEEEYSRN